MAFKRDTLSTWESEGGCTRVADGSGGSLTGKGGAHLIGDDLLKPLEANSEVVREAVNRWYGETFYSRQNEPGAATITICAQRLHEKDVCGFLLAKMGNPDADQWHHVNLPLVCEKRTTYSFGTGRTWTREAGDILNAVHWPPATVRTLRVMLGPNFEGQYQQRPTKQQGGMLVPAKLHRVDGTATSLAKRWGLRVAIYGDLATKEKQTVKDDPDFTVWVAMARDQLDRVWILEVWRKQCAMDEAAAELLAMAKRWDTGLVGGEKIGLQHAFRSVLALTCRVRRVTMPYLRDIPIQGMGDKVQKATAYAGLLRMGMIGVPAGAPWLPELEDEMRTFPLGAHDDQVDAISIGCADLQSIPQGEAPPNHPRLEKGQIDGRMLELAAKRARQIEGEDTSTDDW